MALDTDLSVSPYFASYDPKKDYYHIGFRPGVSVQVRELNDLQLMFQTQIERFGDNILKSGTIVDGCNFQFTAPYPYVKLQDSDVNGNSAAVFDYIGYFAKNSSNLQSVIINAEEGFESTDPNLKTVYLHYRNSGDNGNTFAYAAGDLLTVYDPQYPIMSVQILAGGLNFSNSDVVVFSPQLAMNVSTGTFTNGEYIINPVTGANLQIIGIDDTTLATSGQVLLQVMPRNVDLANASANSDFWTFLIGDSIKNVGNTVTAVVEDIYGFNANATLETDGSGTVTAINMVTGGSNYNYIPTTRIYSPNNATGLASLSLQADNFKAQVRVSNAIASVGNGYAFGVSNGVIYQKGYFLRVEEQLIIVSKYNEQPNNISVGFITNEDIVTSDEDSGLLDNATGELNEFAPGANRLRLTPNLATIQTDLITTNSNFLPVVSFSEGNPFRLQQATAYSAINDEMARRTRESSGNFVTDPFLVTTRSPYTSSYEGNLFSVVVDPGHAYIEGYRVKTDRNFVLDIAKGIDTTTVNNNIVSINYRNYVRINEIGGVFQFSTGDTVNLYDTAKHFISNTGASLTNNLSAVGTLIGTGRIRSLVYESGIPGTANAIYRLYLFNVQMNAGQNFKSVRSIRYAGTYTGVADVVVELDPTTAANVALIHYPSQDKLLFPAGVSVLQNAANTNYTYRTIDQTLSITNTGVITKSIASTPNEFYPVLGDWSDDDMQDIYVVPIGNSLQASVNVAGTVAPVTTSNVLTGSGTTFISSLKAGDYIKLIVNATVTDVRQVTAVTNNTSLTMDANSTIATGNTAGVYRYFPQNIPLPFGNRSGLTVSVDANGNILTANLNMTLTGAVTVNVAAAVNIKRLNATAGTKTASRQQFVKLCLANNAGGTQGPWCIGVPDAIRLRAVYLGSNSSVANTDTNILNEFYLDHNQTQNYLDLGWLFLVPHSTLTLTSADWLLVEYDCLTTSDTGYFDTVSYLSSNLAQIAQVDALPLANLTSTVNTWEVPEIYGSTGTYFDLLNQFDFRPKATNTVVLTGNSALANINPASTLSFGNTADPANDKKFPLPDSTLTSIITQFQGRKDTVFAGKDGNIFALKGIPGNPMLRHPPNQPGGSLKLNDINIPPYPNLPQYPSNTVTEIINTRIANERYSKIRQATHTIRTLLSSGDIETNQPSVYTMRDIGKIDRRLRNIEYYVSLSILETDINSRIIPSSVDPATNRFKFGFFADDFSSQISQDTINPQYNAALVEKQLVPNSYVWTVTTQTNGVYLTDFMDWPTVQQNEATLPANTDNCVCTPVITSINKINWHYTRHRHRSDHECGFRNWDSDDDFYETYEVEYGQGNAVMFFITENGPIKIKIYHANGVLFTTSNNTVAIDPTALIDKAAIADYFFKDYDLGSISFNVGYGNTFVSGHGKIILPVGINELNRCHIRVSKGTRCRRWRWATLAYPANTFTCVCNTVVVPKKCHYVGVWHQKQCFKNSLEHNRCRRTSRDGRSSQGVPVNNYDLEFDIEISSLAPLTTHNFMVQNINKNNRCKPINGNIGDPLKTDEFGHIEFRYFYSRTMDNDLSVNLEDSTRVIIDNGRVVPCVSKLHASLEAPNSKGEGYIDMTNSCKFRVDQNDNSGDDNPQTLITTIMDDGKTYVGQTYLGITTDVDQISINGGGGSQYYGSIVGWRDPSQFPPTDLL